MAKRRVVIAPATVPPAQVTPVVPPPPAPAPVVPAVAAPVPVPSIQPVIPEQLTAEQVAALREENRLLREELARVQQRTS